MRIEQKAKETLEKISLFTGHTLEQTREFFEALTTLLILDYIDSISTSLPFLGDVNFKYIGETLVKNKKLAQVELKINPSEALTMNVNQILNCKEGEDKLCDIILLYEDKINNSLTKKLYE